MVSFQRRCVEGSFAELPPDTAAVEAYLVFLARAHHAAAARTFLAALSLTTTAFNLLTLVSSRHWRVVSAMSKQVGPPSRTWFDLQPVPLCRLRDFDGSSQRQAYGACLTAFVFLLRVSEISAVEATDYRDGVLRIHPAKLGGVDTYRTCSPFMSAWLGALCST